jgi:hypothetical protein
MTVLKRSDIPRPSLPKETVKVKSLGGEVVARAMELGHRVEFSLQSDMAWPERLSPVLARCIVDADGEPIFSAEEWEAWGGKHAREALELWAVVRKLSGIGDEEKNEQAPS